MCFSLVLLYLLVSSSLMGQKPDDAARWIDGLKKTPADELGSGLPHENFAAWFADLVKPNESAYGVEECPIHNRADGVTEQPFCVVVYTTPPHPGWRKSIQLSFIVGSKPNDERATAYTFLRGIEAPANPHIARPDRVFSELSDLEEIVRGSHLGNSDRLRDVPT